MNSLLDNLAAHGIELTHLLLFSIFLMLVFVVWLLIQIKERLDDTKASINYSNSLSESTNHRLCDVNRTIGDQLGYVNRQLSDIQSQGIPPKHPNYI